MPQQCASTGENVLFGIEPERPYRGAGDEQTGRDDERRLPVVALREIAEHNR